MLLVLLPATGVVAEGVASLGDWRPIATGSAESERALALQQLSLMMLKELTIVGACEAIIVMMTGIRRGNGHSCLMYAYLIRLVRAAEIMLCEHVSACSW